MLLALWAEYLYKKRENITIPAKLTVVALLTVAATAIGPYGIKMILHPYEIFSQVQANKFTTELFSFTKREYWQKEAWLNIIFLITAIIGLFLPYKNLQIING